MLTRTLFFLITTGSCLAGSQDVYRPCDLEDKECIRYTLAANSYCNPNVVGMPSVHVIDEYYFEAPYFNSTYVDRHLIGRNHDKCYVAEFYFDYANDAALLIIECPQMDLESNRTRIHHRSYQKDIYTTYHLRTIYPLLRMTFKFPKAYDLDICSVYVFTEVTALPTYNIIPYGPPYTGNPNDLNVFEAEIFAYKGPDISRDYINVDICDFGCTVMTL